MRRVWLIRAGDNAEEIDSMRHAGLIGLRFETVADARQTTSLEIDKRILEDGRVGAAQLRTMLLTFANDIHAGDLVVSPNTARREVWLGVVTGEYQYSLQPRIARYSHTRAVDWLGWLDRDAAWMRDQLKAIDRDPTMYELSSREWWLKYVDSNELSAAPRVSWQTPTVKRTRASSGSSPRTTTTKPKPAPTPRRKPPAALVRCAGTCGYSWPPTSLVDGLCTDCRTD